MNSSNLKNDRNTIPRRDFLKASATTALLLNGGFLPAAFATDGKASKKIPIGLELYSVRNALMSDLPNTLKTVAGMGYEAVEFFSPYYKWSIPYAKDVRTMMDDLGIRCYSTHNSLDSFQPGDGIGKAIELNQILGAKIIVLASAPKEFNNLEAWKKLCDQLSRAAGELKPHGLAAGFHNHQTEWAKLDGDLRTMDVIAASTPREFVLQLDVGTCLEAGADPVAWIKANPGRIRTVHLKDWAPGAAGMEKGYRVLFGEGSAPWKEIITALETTGGVDYYLIEQEGSRYPEFETAQRCLESWKALRKNA